MKFRDLNSGGGKNFLRMKAGETVRGIFRGDPVDFRQHWSNNRGVICPGRDTCELCKAGEKSAFRFRINFVTNENGAYVMKVFEQGKAIYEALKALNQDYNLEHNQMKVTRHGVGTNTTYNILPVPNGTLSKEAEAAVSALKLHQLSESAAPPEADEDD